MGVGPQQVPALPPHPHTILTRAILLFQVPKDLEVLLRASFFGSIVMMVRGGLGAVQSSLGRGCFLTPNLQAQGGKAWGAVSPSRASPPAWDLRLRARALLRQLSRDGVLLWAMLALGWATGAPRGAPAAVPG